MLTRSAPRPRGPIDKKARARRRRGGKLAAGRDSGTRDDLLRERAYVFDRAAGICELCSLRPSRVPAPIATDFAHARARSRGGSNTRWNALATCNPCNLAMQGAFSRGRWLVTPVTRNGVRGFDVKLVMAAGKVRYWRGDFVTLAAGFIRA